MLAGEKKKQTKMLAEGLTYVLCFYEVYRGLYLSSKASTMKNGN